MPRDRRSAWFKTLATLAAVLLLAGAVGGLLGNPWMGVALAAIVTLAWHYWRLHRVLARLAARRRWDIASGTGVWNELDRVVSRNHLEMRMRKRRLLDMLRSYRAAAAALPDAVVVLDRNSQRVQWFNEAATVLLGLHHPGDLGQALVERLQPMPLAHWLAGGRNAEPILDVPSPVDPEIRLNLRLIPYSPEYWLLIARDVSKLLRLEQVRRDFVANVSHELRTPLTVVHGYLDMMDPEDFPGTGPMLEEMRRQSQRMAQLVEDLLTLSRLESQEHGEAEAHSQGRHAIDVEDLAGVDLVGSIKELHSAFSNLVTNAVRYTPAGGRISVMFRREGHAAVLSVCDTGYGIPANHLPRLTERFYRVSSSRSRESGGTGLGLSIVKHILGLHDARLDIQSEVGKGSTFSCHFDAGHVREREPAPFPNAEDRTP